MDEYNKYIINTNIYIIPCAYQEDSLVQVIICTSYLLEFVWWNALYVTTFSQICLYDSQKLTSFLDVLILIELFRKTILLCNEAVLINWPYSSSGWLLEQSVLAKIIGAKLKNLYVAPTKWGCIIGCPKMVEKQSENVFSNVHKMYLIDPSFLFWQAQTAKHVIALQ